MLSDLRLYFVSIFQNTFVSISVSLNEIIYIFPFQFQFPLTNITPVHCLHVRKPSAANDRPNRRRLITQAATVCTGRKVAIVLAVTSSS